MTAISAWAHVACGVAAVAAGGINAVAGGGTLVSFPVMTAVGVPAVRANATNTVALCPGYIGGTFAQRRDLAGMGRQTRVQLVLSAIGGLVGSVLLVVTSEAVFRQIVPFLILGGSALLGLQPRLRAWLTRSGETRRSHRTLELVSVTFAAVYGGYFGAGLGIVLMAVLGLFSDRPLTQVNAVKQLLSIAVNVSAAAFLVFSGKVVWSLVAVMAPASLLGGNLGGRLVGRLSPDLLRRGVVVYGLVVALVYFLR